PSAYLAMFRELAIPWGLSELAAHYTPNWHHVYRAAKIPVSKWEIADKLWAKHYAHHAPKLVPGARRILSWVARRYELGLVTSGDRTRVLRQLRLFGLTRLFATHVCAGETPPKKPHPAPPSPTPPSSPAPASSPPTSAPATPRKRSRTPPRCASPSSRCASTRAR